jgi:hypothetical protein
VNVDLATSRINPATAVRRATTPAPFERDAQRPVKQSWRRRMPTIVVKPQFKDFFQHF